MEKQIIDNIKRLAFGVLKDECIVSEKNYNFNDAENMDSVNRVAILVAIENEYDFIFKLKEISSWNTIMELVEIVERKV